jgi:hypothetical protein
MLCGNFIGIDKLERLKLLQSDPLVNEFAISIKEPETVSRFLGNFSYKTTHMLRERLDTSESISMSSESS